MKTITVNAEARKSGEKNSSKKAFRNHQIVGVLYSSKENFPIKFDRHDFEKLIPKIRSNTLMNIKVGSKERLAFVKDYTFFLKNHRIQHMDFQEIVPGTMVKIHVPLEFHGVPVGISKGGFIQVLVKSVRVKCDSQSIPEKINIDISGLDVNQSVYLRHAPELPGVKYMESPNLSLLSVVLSSKQKSEGGATAAPASDKEATKEAAPAKAPAKEATKEVKGKK